MGFDGAKAHVEPSRDLRIRVTSGDKLCDPRLSGRQPIRAAGPPQADPRQFVARPGYQQLRAERLEHGQRLLERLLGRGLTLRAPFYRTLLKQRAAVLEWPVTAGMGGQCAIHCLDRTDEISACR